MASRTPCRRSEELSRRIGAEIYLKLENLQASGSFKLRGVANKILSLTAAERARTLIAASTGNHGAAFAHVVRDQGLEGRLFLPRNAAARKLESIKNSGLPYELVGDDCIEAELHAAAYAKDHGCTLVPPYNDPAVVAGQGTMAIEILEQLDTVDVVLAPVGGGGLMAGVSAYCKQSDPGIEIIGCQPEASAVMYDSIRAGRIVYVESRPTLSDATAGGIEEGSITFDLCREYVDDFVLLAEGEIADAIRCIHDSEGMVIEGGAALSVAAALKRREHLAGRRVVLVISGSKIDDDVLATILR